MLPNNLQRFLPFLAWIGELRDKNVLRADFMAGLTVALVLIPQSMAYAQLAGLPAYYGLYAAFLPPMIASLFGSSRQLATGPVAVVSLLTAAALEPLAAQGSAGYVSYAILLALLVGLFQLSLGLLRLGVLVNFLAHPVVLGFTNAAAIIIATSQLSKIFGVSVPKSEHHYETVWDTIVAATQYTHWMTFGFAALAFAIMYLIKRYTPKLPGVLIAVALTTVLSYFIGFERTLQVPVENIVDESARDLVLEQSKMRKEISQLNEQILEAEEKYNLIKDEYGEHAEPTLAAHYLVDNLKLKRERRKTSADKELEALKKLRFEYVPGHTEADGRFYIGGRVPQGVDIDGKSWRIGKIDKDGSLKMDGGGKVVGTIPDGLPSMSMPEMNFSVIVQLLSAAITISLIGFMEAISIAKAMAAKTRQRLDPNQELIGQGIGNITGSLFQSYPTSGSFSRSAVNIGSGAVTGFSAVVTSLIVVISLLWLTPLLYHLPEATLAAVIMMAVFGLVNVEAIKHAWHAHTHDGAVAIITFVLTLAFAPHLDNGIMIGAGLSLILYLYRNMSPRVAVLARHPDGTLRDAERFNLELCDNISMVRFDGALFFANVSYFEDKVLERVSIKPHLKYIIVVGDGINEIDASGEEMLVALVDRLRKSNIEFIFTGLKKQVLDVMARTGFTEHLGEKAFFRTEEHALEYVWEKLGDDHEASCPLNVVCPLEKEPLSQTS